MSLPTNELNRKYAPKNVREKFRHHLVRGYRSLVQQFEPQTHHKDRGQAKSQFTLKLLSKPGETPARDAIRPRPDSSSGLTPPPTFNTVAHSKGIQSWLSQRAGVSPSK